jgi:hypothetical protein
MNIVVCVKQVPDTEVERSLKAGDGTLDRESADGVINYIEQAASGERNSDDSAPPCSHISHLRGEAGPRQIEGARVSLTHVIGLGSACGVHIMEK